jgi:hypothetical protein
MAAQASFAAVTFGGNLETEPETVDKCTDAESGRGCLEVTQFIPGRDLVAPFDGVIVRWRARFGPNTEAQTIRIRVIQIVLPNRFKFISSGPLESIPEGAGTYTFAASLPIAAGEQVGLEGESEKGIEVRGHTEVAGADSWVFNPSGLGLDGSTTGTPAISGLGTEATFNVEVEPDCDHDGLGDETQDSDLPPACKPQPQPQPVAAPSNAITLGKPKLNKKKGTAKLPVTIPGPGTLTLTGKGVVNQTTTPTAAGTAKLLVKSKGKKRQKLNSMGSTKVTSTVTYTPTGGASNSVIKKLVLKKLLP